MAKKVKKSSMGKYLTLAAILFAVASVCMIFVNAVKYQVSESADPSFYKGTQIVFGYSKTSGSVVSVTTTYLKFSFMAMLPYLLALVGAILLVLNVVGKENKLVTFVAFAAFVVAAVFFFLAPKFPIPAKGESTGIALLDKKYFSLAIGSILAAIFSIVSALCLAVKTILK